MMIYFFPEGIDRPEERRCLILIVLLGFFLADFLSAQTPGSTSATISYLNRLKPVLNLHFDQAAAKSETTLGNQVRLERPAEFRESGAPGMLDGPANWTGKGWDFSKVQGPVLVGVDEAMARVGDPGKTSGFTVSFWTKGEYSGRTSRIMTGPFDIGTTREGIWGGSNDYQNAQSPRQITVWDGQWHHVAVRVNFSAETENIDLWLDGKRIASRTAFYSRSLATRVGRHWVFGGRTANDPGFDYGALADIAVFDRPLTEEDIGYIHAGPVFAGLNQTLYLPGETKLVATVPEKGEAVWTQVSGPVDVVKGEPKGAELPLRFSQPGEYGFQVAASGLTSEIRVEIRPNEPPIVHAGNGAVINAKKPLAMLKGTVSDNGEVGAKGVNLSWSVASAPPNGNVKFRQPDQAECEAEFSGEGLYTLRLTGDDGEFSQQSEVSFLVGKAQTQSSYLHLLRPLLLVDFASPPALKSRAVADAAGRTGLRVQDSANGIPLMTHGAREVTGYAWDFGQSDAALKVVNGIHLKPVHSQQHPARSVSFWCRGDEKMSGYLTSFVGLLAIDRSGALVHHLKNLPQLHSNPVKLNDGQWHHVALVIQTRDRSIQRRLFVDGTLLAEGSDPDPNEWKALSSFEIRHAQFIGSRGRSGADNFSGALDDFALFDYALTETDINYIVSGPGETDRNLLEQMDSLHVDAGEDRFLRAKDAASSVRIEGKIKGDDPGNLSTRWSVIQANGTVKFSDPDKLVTEVSFNPDTTTKSGDYTRFVLRLSLIDPESKRTIASDEMATLFYPDRAPPVRKLSPAPPAGEHPRVLFSKADRPELKQKAALSPVAKRALAAMGERTKMLDNPGQNYGNAFAALLEGKRCHITEIGGDNGGGFFLTMLEAAYLAWLEEDRERMKTLARAFGQAAREFSESYIPIYENALCHDVNWAVGLCYDLLHDFLNEDDRTICRNLLSAMTSFRQSVGVDNEPWANSTNWRGYHDHFLMCLLAIEGEDGFDATALDVCLRKNAIFQTQYGIFDSGFPHEGYAYYTFGMQWMSVANVAVVRRPARENLAETTRFYSSIEAGFRLLDPNGSGIRPHHDVVGGPSGSGLMATPPRHVLAAKFLWPRDRMTDYLYHKLTANMLAGDDNRPFDFFAAIWAEPVAYPDQTLAEAAGERELDPVEFCPDRGFLMARDGWKENGLRLDFRCRMDKYQLGHQHADVNSFELWSHGREWIIDRGKFGGVTSDVTSTVLIDGVAGPSAKRFTWPSFPGRFVHFADTDESVIGIGDAKPFYDFCPHPPRHNPGPPIKDHGIKWSDFYFPREGETIPDWMKKTPVDLDGYGNANAIHQLNTVRRAVRSVALAKGKHPFVIVADDIEKDGQPHAYDWIANLPIGDRIVEVSGNKSDLILRHKQDAEGGPRLLVRVLRADGQSAPIRLDRSPVIVEKDKIDAVRLVIPCHNTVAPNYRVMFYPFAEGDPHPETTWEGNELLRVKIGDDAREVNFGEREGAAVIEPVDETAVGTE